MTCWLHLQTYSHDTHTTSLQQVSLESSEFKLPLLLFLTFSICLTSSRRIRKAICISASPELWHDDLKELTAVSKPQELEIEGRWT